MCPPTSVFLILFPVFQLSLSSEEHCTIGHLLNLHLTSTSPVAEVLRKETLS